MAFCCDKNVPGFSMVRIFILITVKQYKTSALLTNVAAVTLTSNKQVVTKGTCRQLASALTATGFPKNEETVNHCQNDWTMKAVTLKGRYVIHSLIENVFEGCLFSN